MTAPSAEDRLGNDEPALFPNATVRLCPKINHIALAHRREVLQRNHQLVELNAPTQDSARPRRPQSHSDSGTAETPTNANPMQSARPRKVTA